MKKQLINGVNVMVTTQLGSTYIAKSALKKIEKTGYKVKVIELDCYINGHDFVEIEL